MRICALVLNYRRPEHTIRCLDSLRRHAQGVDVLVVDNASEDGSVERILEAHPTVPLLRNERNDGYAGGNNAGFRALLARHLPPDAVLVLNNDVYVLPGCIDALIDAAARDPGRGILAPVSLDAADPELLDFHFAQLDLENMAVQAFGRGERRDPDRDRDSDYAPGSALLIRTPVLETLGGFDERYFLVWEDVDLSLRAGRAGFGKPLIVANARVLHEGSATFGDPASPLYRYYLVRNSFLVARTHLRGIARWRALRLLRRRYAGWIEQADEAVGRAIARGLEDGRAGRFGPASDEVTGAGV